MFILKKEGISMVVVAGSWVGGSQGGSIAVNSIGAQDTEGGGSWSRTEVGVALRPKCLTLKCLLLSPQRPRP